MKPDWLPDWKDPTAYPNPENTNAEQWAWEFLRRNSEYQRDYVLWKEAHKGNYQPKGELTHQMIEEFNRRTAVTHNFPSPTMSVLAGMAENNLFSKLSRQAPSFYA